MKFIDANVIIKAFTENKDKDKCRKILQDVTVTDTLVLLEAHHAIQIITADKLYASQCIKSIFKSHILIVNLDKDLLFESIKKTEKYNLTIFDLVHLTAALNTECREFVSYDKDFDNLELKRTEP